ncbi:hypothetical protein, partial [Siminovitchia fortis]|uniref:hypothetical protein n=1 Tax=Siminovitchia fortis TaxID=254758 RepID=UPI001C92EEC0
VVFRDRRLVFFGEMNEERLGKRNVVMMNVGLGWMVLFSGVWNKRKEWNGVGCEVDCVENSAGKVVMIKWCQGWKQ